MLETDHAEPVTASEFVRSGILGPVRIGMLLEEMVAVWGEPTEFHLSRPPACSYGPLWIGYRLDRNDADKYDRRITHAAFMVRDLQKPGPPGFAFDIPVESQEAVTRALATMGLHTTRAEDQMYPGELEVVLRVAESGIELVFDEAGRLSCIAIPLPQAD